MAKREQEAKYSARTVLIIIFIALSGLFMLITCTNLIDKRSFMDISIKLPANRQLIIPKQESSESSSFALLHNCWLHIFITDFVQNKLHHTIKNDDKSSAVFRNCNVNDIQSLLSQTNDFFDNGSELLVVSLHDLISLRRIVMLLATEKNLQMSEEYIIFISLISDAMHIADDKNPNKVIMNVHPPRSAGTTICGYFRGAKRRQSQLSNSTKPILFNTAKGKNCNAGDGDGNQFTHYPNDAKASTCQQQYDLVVDKYTFIGRESPLYNNKNEKVAHSCLCPQFIYMLAIRSPIERILSWLTADTLLQKIYANKTKQRVEKGDYIPNFYASLFDYSSNKPQSNVVKIMNSEAGSPNIVMIMTRNQWLRGYSSNAITKWVGYEWKNANEVKESKDITEPMSVDINEVNGNDVHFYNAIKAMLQTDYVLNFASYENDSTTLNALKYESMQQQFDDDDIINIFHGIGSKDSMWNIFSEHMNEHFNQSNLFVWGQRRPKVYTQGGKSINPDMLTHQDWTALYEQNYFDYRLYFLAKYIEKVDLTFYEQY